MTLFKKTALLCLSLLTCLTLGAAVACDNSASTSSPSESSSSRSESSVEDESDVDEGNDDPEAGEDDSYDYVYRISVENLGGYGFPGVTVTLKDGDAEVASKTTNASGNANFLAEDIDALGAYSIEVSGYPEGYDLSQNTVTETAATAGWKSTVVITPSSEGVLEGSPKAGQLYKLGDRMHDFTVTTTDNKTYTLSQVLKEKQLVLLNFWATWCSPCKAEFPAMHNAALAYKDTVSVIAISVTDSKAGVADFKSKNGLTQFDMAEAGSGDLSTMFNVYTGSSNTRGVPTSVLIDRYGVVTFLHSGTMTAAQDFTVRFDKFLGDDYVPTILAGDGSGDVTTDEEEDEMVKPNVSAPGVAAAETALLNAADKDNFELYWKEADKGPTETNEEYAWPWLIGTEDGSEYLYAANGEYHSSFSQFYVDFTAEANDVIAFDYFLDSEKYYDVLYVFLDETPILELSGTHSDWETCYAYVFKDYEAGEHTLGFFYMKDEDDSNTNAASVVQIRNLRFSSLSDIEDVDGVQANVFRYAATVRNGSLNAASQYQNYVTVEYNENDGYYHVGDANGPILFANLLLESLWNDDSVWNLAYNNKVFDGPINLKEEIEKYAWEANVNLELYGYTPVTQGLKELLQLTTQNVTQTKQWSQTTANGEYFYGTNTTGNEWLELCIYYEYYGEDYGDDIPFADMMAGLTYNAAIEMSVPNESNGYKATTDVSVPRVLNPRGFKYAFTPEISGAYKVYSRGNADPVCFLQLHDLYRYQTTELGTWDDKFIAESDEEESQFEFYWYFEAGTTYYILCTTYLDIAAEYTVTIEYLGASHSYLENAATSPYSYTIDAEVMELYLPNAIEYAYADKAESYVFRTETGATETRQGDGYYHYKYDDGALGSIIYLDALRPTSFFDSTSLYSVLELLKDGSGNFNVAEEDRPFYLSHIDPDTDEIIYTDYTELLNAYCFRALLNEGELNGFVAVDAELYELLRAITQSVEYDGIDDDWLQLCYYYRTVYATV